MASTLPLFRVPVLGDSMTGNIVMLVCRLCALPSEDGVEIFSERGIEGCLPEKISKCLPILVSAYEGQVFTV